jgi:predicted HTH domain antitoxin
LASSCSKIKTALDKYGQGSITLLKAAEIAGTSIYEMIALLEERRIPYRYDISDLEEHVKRHYG